MASFNPFRRKEKEEIDESTPPASYNADVVRIDEIPKPFWQKVFPVIAAGSGLFSEGYVTSVCWVVDSFSSHEETFRGGYTDILT